MARLPFKAMGRFAFRDRYHTDFVNEFTSLSSVLLDGAVIPLYPAHQQIAGERCRTVKEED
jgi:hypothetical protein